MANLVLVKNGTLVLVIETVIEILLLGNQTNIHVSHSSSGTELCSCEGFPRPWTERLPVSRTLETQTS